MLGQLPLLHYLDAGRDLYFFANLFQLELLDMIFGLGHAFSPGERWVRYCLLFLRMSFSYLSQYCPGGNWKEKKTKGFRQLFRRARHFFVAAPRFPAVIFSF
jgi:hypothetical protein